jgi:hypothetical protein
MLQAKSIFSASTGTLMHKINKWGINHSDLKTLPDFYTYIKLDDPTNYYFTLNDFVPKAGYFSDHLPIATVGQILDYTDLIIYIRTDVKKAYLNYINEKPLQDILSTLQQKNKDLSSQNKSLLEKLAILTSKL